MNCTRALHLFFLYLSFWLATFSIHRTRAWATILKSGHVVHWLGRWRRRTQIKKKKNKRRENKEKIHTNNPFSFWRQVVYDWLCPIDIRCLRWQNIPVSLICRHISLSFLFVHAPCHFEWRPLHLFKWHSSVWEQLSLVSAVLYPDRIFRGLESLAARQPTSYNQRDRCLTVVPILHLRRTFSHTYTHAHTHV